MVSGGAKKLLTSGSNRPCNALYLSMYLAANVVLKGNILLPLVVKYVMECDSGQKGLWKLTHEQYLCVYILGFVNKFWVHGRNSHGRVQALGGC